MYSWQVNKLLSSSDFRAENGIKLFFKKWYIAENPDLTEKIHGSGERIRVQLWGIMDMSNTKFLPILCDFVLKIFTISISIMIFFLRKRGNPCFSPTRWVLVVPRDKNVQYALNCLLVAREATFLVYPKSLNFASLHVYRIPLFGFYFPRILYFHAFNLNFEKKGIFPTTLSSSCRQPPEKRKFTRPMSFLSIISSQLK